MESTYWTRVMSGRVARRRLLAGAGAAGVAGILAACGGGDGGTKPADTQSSASGTASTAAAQGTAAAAPAVQGKFGGTIKIGHDGASLTNFDPHTGASGAEHQIFFAVTDPIVGYDQKGNLDPSISLAEKWELPEPTRIVLKLRPGVKFHDGAEFGAEDVKWNIERIIDPTLQATPRSDLASIESVQAVNKEEAVLRLKEPSAPLLTNFGDRGGQMISRTALEKVGKDTFRRSPVGTGPYTIKQWNEDAFLIFERNPNYWRTDGAGKQLPYLQTIRIEFIPEATVRTAAFEAGDVDVMVGVPALEVKRLAADKNFQMSKFVGSGTSFWYINHAFPPLDNVWFRRALSASLDRETYIKNFLVGDEPIVTGFLTPATWAHDPTIQNYNYDIAKAKQYLQQSGLPPDKWKIRTQPFGTAITDAEQFWAASAKEAGIVFDFAPGERDGWQKRVLKGLGGDGSSGMYVAGLSLRVDPDGHIGPVYTEKGAYNSGQAPVPETEPLVVKARQTYDQAERKKIYAEVQRKGVEQVYSGILFVYGVARSFARKNVGNFENFYGGEGKPRYANLWT